MAFNLPTRVRQSVAALGLSLILLEFLYFAIYSIFFFLLLLGYIRLTQETVYLAFSFFLAIFLMLNLSKIVITLILILRWLRQNYEIRKGEISYTEGLLTRREKMFNILHVEDVVISQGFFGKMFRFGTIRLHNPVLNKKFYMYSVPHPERYAKIIREAIRGTPGGEEKVSILRDDINLPI